MALPTRARIAGILAIFLLMISAPGALAGTNYQPDASIRLGSGSYVGENMFLPQEQAVSGTGDMGDRLTFWVKIKNVGALADSFRVGRSAGYNDGYKVRYKDANGVDVTGKVNVGGFTTPSLFSGQEYVMRATVKVRSLATVGSSTSRLLTVSSVNVPAAQDAVRFTGGLEEPLLSLNWTGSDDNQAYATITGSGLKPNATVYMTTYPYSPGPFPPSPFSVGTVSGAGDVDITGLSFACDFLFSIDVSTLAPDLSLVEDTGSPPC